MIRLFAGTVVPRGWQMCDGTLLQIGANQALFAILSTRYGGDGILDDHLQSGRGMGEVEGSVVHAAAQPGTPPRLSWRRFFVVPGMAPASDDQVGRN
jgi:microcystin-dependent protein